MDVEYTTITSGTTSITITVVAGGYVPLYHGTDYESAISITTGGLDPVLAARNGGEGFLWTTQDYDRARHYGIYSLSDKPRVLRFPCPLDMFTSLLHSSPQLVYPHPVVGIANYRFLPESFPVLNTLLDRVLVIDSKSNLTAPE